MNIEVEIKVRLDEAILRELKAKLPKFGKLVKSIRQIDEYYTPYHWDFFARKPHPNEWLRIRTNPDSVVFEYDRSFDRKDGYQDYANEI